VADLRNQEFGTLDADVIGLLVNPGAGIGVQVDVKAAEAVCLRHPGSAFGHPGDHLRPVAHHDIGPVLPEPTEKRLPRHVRQNQRRYWHDFPIDMPVRQETGEPPMLQAVAFLAQQNEAGAPVAELGQPGHRRHHRSRMIGTDRVERGQIDQVVGVDPGVIGPAQLGEIGPAPGRHDEHSANSARLQDGVEAVDGQAALPHHETFQPEAELGGAFGRPAEQIQPIGARESRSFRFLQTDCGQRSVKRRESGSANLAQDRACQRVDPIPRRLRGLLDAFARAPVHAGLVAQRLGHGGARNAQLAGETADGGTAFRIHVDRGLAAPAPDSQCAHPRRFARSRRVSGHSAGSSESAQKITSAVAPIGGACGPPCFRLMGARKNGMAGF